MKVCVICGDPYFALDYCVKHYYRFIRWGSPHYLAIQTHGSVKSCTATGCNDDHHAKGYCQRHYERLMRLGTIANMNGEIEINYRS